MHVLRLVKLLDESHSKTFYPIPHPGGIVRDRLAAGVRVFLVVTGDDSQYDRAVLHGLGHGGGGV